MRICENTLVSGEDMNSKTMLYIAKRILLAIFTVWVVITVTFFVMHAVPGGPFTSDKQVSKAVLDALNEKYKLNYNFFIQGLQLL